jgi:predicted phage gp36 major capsid-like protein
VEERVKELFEELEENLKSIRDLQNSMTDKLYKASIYLEKSIKDLKEIVKEEKSL